MMEYRRPNILVSYPGPSTDEREHDIFLYLRPQSNGIRVESILLKEIEKDPHYRKDFHLVYLANLPGDFLRKEHVIEQHYSLRIYFATHGAKMFTTVMRREFSRLTGEDFSSSRIMGSFEALDTLSMSPRQLFETWVGKDDVFSIMGQCIKRYEDPSLGNCYVINYDVPMLLHMNNRDTDIATMLFRTRCGYTHFYDLVDRMKQQLLKAGVIDTEQDISRVLHFSRGPFEEILDAKGHLYHNGGAHVPLGEYSFVRYLMQHGISLPCIKGFMDHPLVTCREGKERNLFEYSASLNYSQALKQIQCVTAVTLLPTSSFQSADMYERNPAIPHTQ